MTMKPAFGIPRKDSLLRLSGTLVVMALALVAEPQLSAAANRATPGTTIQVREGVYNEMVVVTKSGKRHALISFVVDGDDHVVVDSPGYACFDLRGVRYIKIHGFELTGAYGGEGTEAAHGGALVWTRKRSAWS